MPYTDPSQLGGDQRVAYANRNALVSQALARGVSQAHIDSFLRENPFDYQRLNILEADAPATASLAPGYAGPGGSSASIGPYAPMSSPYSSANQPSGIFSSSAADSTLTGHALADNVSRPQIVTSGSGAPVSMLTLPASGIPPWMYLAALALLALLLLKGK